jgi:cell wall assembly regulator SMI1
VRDGRVAERWAAIETWLATHAPETLGTLRPPAEPVAVEAAERAIGVTFPADLRASLARHDGATDGPATFQLAGDYQLMRIDDIVPRWRAATDALDHDDRDELIRSGYWHPRWVPFAKTNSVDMLVVDCRPGPTYGAVGIHQEGDGTHFGLWADLAALLSDVADALSRDRPIRHWHPVAYGGRLRWEIVEEQHPAPRSLLDLADPARRSGTPGQPVSPPERDRVPPHPDAGWVGEYGYVALTFVAGIDEAELLRRFGADPARAVPRTRTQARALRDSWVEGYLPVLRVGRAGRWAFAVEEERRPEGVRPEVLRRLSAGTRAVALHYTGSGTRFTLVEDGTPVIEGDTLHPARWTGRDPGRFLPALRAAGLAPPDATRYPDEDVPALLGVLRTELGIEFDGDLLRPPLPSTQFLPVLPDPPTTSAVSARVEPLLAAQLAYADEERLRAALLAQARRLAAETGLDGYPELVVALDRAAAGDRWRVEDESPLGLRVRRIAAEANAASASRGDAVARDLITEPERRAWARRQLAAEAIVHVLGPTTPRISGGHLLRRRLHPNWRAQFGADLGPVPLPDGAVEELVAAEERERTAGPLVPLVVRPRRQPPSPGHPRPALRPVIRTRATGGGVSTRVPPPPTS